MSEYDNYINDVLSELERATRFTLGLYAERTMFMKILTLLMMDKGVYELEIKDQDMDTIEGYGVSYEIKDGVVKISIDFPEVKPSEIL